MNRLYPFFTLCLFLALLAYLSSSYNETTDPSKKSDVLNSDTNEQTPASEQQVATQEESKEQQTNSASNWPQEMVTSLKEAYPDQSDAIDHIVKATTFENFASLTAEKSKRLIDYADRVSGLPSHLILNLCWHYNAPAHERSAFEDVRNFALAEAPIAQPAFRFAERWLRTVTDGDTGSQGTPVTIRWSFVPDGTPVPDDLDVYSDSDLIATFNNVYGAPSVPGDLTTAPWFEIFEDAFEYWAEVTGNIYIYEPNDDGAAFPDLRGGAINVRGDVRIGGTDIDGEDGILAFNYFPDFGDMVIDTSDSSNLSNESLIFVKNLIAHEHGHGLGLNHVCPTDGTKLMEPFVSGAFEGPQFDDILTGQALYGDLLERQSTNKDNDTPSTAYSFGTLDTGVSSTTLSIANALDTDVFSFQVSSSQSLNLSVKPTEQEPYLEGMQDIDSGSCSSGTIFDPQARQNLAVQILAADGTTVLASSDNSDIGEAESLQLPFLETNQDYYIAVAGGGENFDSNNNAQAYSLDITLTNAGSLKISTPIIVNENCLPANGLPDPDEIITISVDVENIDTETVTNASVTLSGSNNLAILGPASFNIDALTPGNSTTKEFSFSFFGECRSTESILIRAEGGGGTSTERTVQYTLGTMRQVENFDSTELGLLPDGFTQSSGSAAANWTTVNSDQVSLPNSVYSPGIDNINSAILTSYSIDDIQSATQIEFDHQYNLEDGFDGGILEISIAGGNWVEWTEAGGTFDQGGYIDEISSDDLNPIGGSLAWTGPSGSFIHTIANFPQSAVGQSARVRWHLGNDIVVRTGGWWIDNITLVQPLCCESLTPNLSISAVDSVASEFDSSDTAEIVVSSDINLNLDFPVAYTVSGNAIEGSDFAALAGFVTIPSGQSLAPIPITAIKDMITEGNETLVLTLEPSVFYSIVSGTASITIKDLPFDEYRHTYFGGSTTNIAEDEDFDFDGIKNLLEYAFRLDAATPDTLPFNLLVKKDEDEGGTTLELNYYEDTQIEDITYIVETSSTLASDSWTTEGVTITSGTTTDGLISKTASISASSGSGFIRIRVERVIP